MKKKILTFYIFLLPVCCFSQVDCPDSLAVYGTFSTYSVDSFPLKTPIEINLTSITVGSKQIKLDFDYKAEIEFETTIIPLTDSTGIKLLLTHYQRYGKKFYLYNLLFYRKEKKCWIELGSSDMMWVATSQKFATSNSAVGSPGSPYYVTVNEGWIKLN